MRIAIIGWGSLIRCPGALRLASKWRRGGPELPLEFSRRSSGERLTLVIDESAGLQPTFWAISGCESLDEACEELRKREGTSASRIHSIPTRGKRCLGRGIPSVVDAIREWIGVNDEADQVCWTGLSSEWPEEASRAFGPFGDEAVIAFLRCLEYHGVHHGAELYFRHAPPEIDTSLRRRVEEELGWAREPLPPELLEPS